MEYSAFKVSLIVHICNLFAPLNAMIYLVSKWVNLTSNTSLKYIKEEA